VLANIQIQTIAVTYLALLFSLSVHESAHAASAYWLEDDTAKRLGRMTLNPLPHIDLLGTLVLPLLGMFTGWRVLGWAKPVPVDPRNLTRKFTQRTGMAIVAGAGPVSNLLLSLLCIPLLAMVIRIFADSLGLTHPVQALEVFFDAVFKPTELLTQGAGANIGLPFMLSLLGKMVIINIGLAIFNLLPFGPLDGASIMRGFLPWKMVPAFDRVQPTLAILVLVLFFVGWIKYLLEPIFRAAIKYYIFPLAQIFLGV